MGVTFIAPQGTYTAPAKLVSKSITENGTYDPADDNANGYSSVKVEVEGGGGSSDFSTAEVTITNNSEVTYEVDSVFIEEDSLVIYKLALPSSTHTRTVVLYKGLNHMSINDENDDPVPVNAVSMTGDVSYDESEFTITGNGTITIS